MALRHELRFFVLIAVLIAGAAPTAAYPFPPYRSTDADTAEAGVLELRLGVLKMQRERSVDQFITPLLRANIGVGDSLELIAELEYSPDLEMLAEGASGLKWARQEDGFGVGVEALVLLPVQQGHSGAGGESLLIATLERDQWQVHANAGAFYDRRPEQTQQGWRASVLAEFPRGNFRPGLELFAKAARDAGKQVQSGIGLIAEVAGLEIRVGLHVGLTEEAPDFEASVWLSSRWRIWKPAE